MTDTPRLPDGMLIDESVLEEMASVIRPAEMAVILRVFIDDTAARVARARAAAAATDLPALADECHDLASTLGTFGASALMASARKVLDAARAGDAPTALRLLPDLLDGAERMTAMLNSRVAGNGHAEG